MNTQKLAVHKDYLNSCLLSDYHFHKLEKNYQYFDSCFRIIIDKRKKEKEGAFGIE